MSDERKQTDSTMGNEQNNTSSQDSSPETFPRRRASDFVSPGLVDYEPPVLRCLSIISGMLGHPVSTLALKSGMPQGQEKPTLAECIRAAEQASLMVQTFHKPLANEISSLIMPCILILQNDQACILVNINGEKAEVVFPQGGGTGKRMPVQKLQDQYIGYALLVQPESQLDQRASELRLVDTKAWFWGTIFRFMPIYKHVIMATIFINILTIASPIYILSLYDRVVPNNAIDTLWALSFGIILAYFFEFILRNLRSYFTDIAGKNADIIIASKLMQQMMAMRLDNRPDSSGVMANNLREFETLRDFFSSTTLTALVDLPFVIIYISLIAYIGGPVAFVPLCTIPIVIFGGILVQRPFQKVVEKSFREGAQKNALLIEAINGVESIKTSMAEGQVQKRWEEVVGMNARSTGSARTLSNLTTTFSHFIAQLTTVAVLIWGVYRIAEGEMTIGGLIACKILVGRSMSPLGTIASMLTRFQRSRMALKSLDFLMSQPNERPAGQDFMKAQDIDHSLSLNKVRFRYPNSQSWALDGIKLQINAGEKVGIIGRTGSGKSTLGRLCLGLYQPQEGSVKLGGIDLRQLHVADLRHHIGYVSQDNYLFYGTIRENIALGTPYVDGHAVLTAANIAGVTDFVRKHPSGFECQVGERGMNLSGGQRQAVAIARALILEPQILILDEPTSAMDNTSEKVLRERMRKILNNKTLILFTHRTSMLQLVDRLIVMDGGKIVADGPKEEVLSSLSRGEVRIQQ